MNFPPRTAAACDREPGGPFDLRIIPGNRIKVAEDGQSAETLDLATESGVGIACYDFGAYGHLKVIAETEDGLTLVAHRRGEADDVVLDLPLDENRNHVADAWEKRQAVWDRNLPATWDGAEEPAGQALRGDGISLYEKYRGFEVLKSVGKEVHERLDPKRKHVFVRNPDRLAREVFASADGLPESYAAAAECEVRYVGAVGWTGPGTFKDRRRVVNFNCSEDEHAVDQHALHVVVVTSPSPLVPDDVNALLVAAGLPIEEPLDDGVEGVAYLDPTAPAAAIDQWRPSKTLRIEVYGANVKNYSNRSLMHHTRPDCPGCTLAAWKAKARAYESDHGMEAGRKYAIELSATITHEMGHGTGVRHHRPTSDNPAVDDLRNCTMRYYDPAEFPPNVNDRYELEARGNNPDSFCRRAHNCWGQIKITDNLRAEAGAPATPAAIPWSLRRPLLASAGADAAGQGVLEVSADLAWEEVVEGDPLRLWVRLHDPTDAVTGNWVDGVRPRLTRVLADARPEEVLVPGEWDGGLRPNAFEPSSLAIPHVTRVAEWLVEPGRARLAAGRYRLGVSWVGGGLAPAGSLPLGGTATLPDPEFDVVPASTPGLQALHQRHLAWERFVAEDPAGVVALVREADRLDPAGSDPMALQGRMMGAASSARLGDAFGTVEFLDLGRTGDDGGNDHLAAFAAAAYRGLAPRLELLEAPAAGGIGGTRLRVTAPPSGVFVIERSGDLAAWTAISTNTPSTNRFDVAVEPDSGRAVQRYYRVRWMR